MKTFLTLFTIVIFIFQSSFTIAGDKRYLEVDGSPGYWFDTDTADRILEDLTELSLIKEKKIPAFNQKIQLQETLITGLKRELKVSESISARYSEALEKSEENYKDLEEAHLKSLSQKQVWYKSTSFVFILGIFSGSLLAVGLSYGLKRD